MAMPESMMERPVRNQRVSGAAMEVPEWFHEMILALLDLRTTDFWRNCAAKGKELHSRSGNSCASAL